MPMIVSDLGLSRKLERTEARANADFVETRRLLDTACGACWIETGGAYAMFDGPDSPLTQTFGLGIFEDATNEILAEIETFFREREAPIFHEVSPMADPSLMTLLNERGYRPIELTSVMYREISRDAIAFRQRDPRLSTRVINNDEVDLWARTSARAWATVHESLAEFMLNFGQISAQCPGGRPYIAELNGEAIATGMLFIFDDVCILAGASTVPEGRNKGAQNALLEDRLKFAADVGCTLAIMGAAPGSQSQSNAQKNGFNIAYTRTKWQLVG